jgi:hypothetical protein
MAQWGELADTKKRGMTVKKFNCEEDERMRMGPGLRYS